MKHKHKSSKKPLLTIIRQDGTTIEVQPLMMWNPREPNPEDDMFFDYDATITEAEYQAYLDDCKYCNSVPIGRRRIRRWEIEQMHKARLWMAESHPRRDDNGNPIK